MVLGNDVPDYTASFLQYTVPPKPSVRSTVDLLT
jgi:hypothetical protein